MSTIEIKKFSINYYHHHHKTSINKLMLITFLLTIIIIDHGTYKVHARPLSWFSALSHRDSIITTTSTTTSPSTTPAAAKNQTNTSTMVTATTVNATTTTSDTSNTNTTAAVVIFPPSYCVADQECIGRNATSRIFYDPNARCDVAKHVCHCRLGYQRVQFRIKPDRGGRSGGGASSSSSTSSTSQMSSNNAVYHQNYNYNLSTGSIASLIAAASIQPLYVLRCVQDVPSSSSSSSSSFGSSASSSSSSSSSSHNNELTVFLRSLHYYGQICEENRQCAANLICRQLMPSAAISRDLIAASPPVGGGGGGSTPKPSSTTGSSSWSSRLLANRTKRCRCPIGQHWNKHSRRCEWPSSSSSSSFYLNGNNFRSDDSRSGYHYPLHPSSGGNGGGGGGGLNPTIHHSGGGGGQSSLDLKVFEIIMEISFLIGCLLGYKVFSKVCCKEKSHQQDGGIYNSSTSTETCSFTNGSGSSGGGDSPNSPNSENNSSLSDEKVEIKSDEESILTTGLLGKKSGLRRGSTGKVITTGGGSGGSGGGGSVYKSAWGSKRSAFSARTSRSKRNKTSRICSRGRRATSPYGLQHSPFMSHSGANFRRLSSVSAVTSGMSRSSSASTRNLLVKINPDDMKSLSISTTLAPNTTSPSRTASPCYNCRIYREVYSPNARCKNCRTSLLSVTAADPDALLDGLDSKSSSLLDLDPISISILDRKNSGASMEGGGGGGGTKGTTNGNASNAANAAKQSLLIPPLPPYKQKPIRRSEEVGVPPHLRAPYRDSQPFWLK